jgi:hypothetical protein
MFRVLILLIVSAFAVAQQPAKQRSSVPQQPAKQQPSAPQKQAEQQPTSPQKSAEHKISPQEADELFKSVDELMQFASKETGLPIRTKVKRKLISRDEVEKFLQKKLDEDEDTKRMERSSLILKKFGLLPPDFDLRTQAVKLLRDQIAAFYDPKEKTVNMLDWLDPDTQRPVLVHELTHALQDQQVDLEKWLKEPDELDGKDAFNKGIRSDEASIARSAVTEGQAMVVFVDYLLAPAKRTLEDSPGIIPMMRDEMASQMVKGAFKDVPLILSESLMFPYVDGFLFEAELLNKGGKPKAFVDALKHPPVNSHQILSPETYILSEKQPDPVMPDLAPVLNGKYAKYDSGAVGQFDTEVLLRQFEVENSKDIATKWRGGMYYAGQRSEKEPKTAADIALLYVSYWKDEGSAAEFKQAYEKTIEKRYGASRADVRLLQDGWSVIVTEGFDEKTALALEQQVKEPTAKVALDHGSLSSGLARWIAALRW